ncbi:MAG: MATE family efflux transporter [Acidimicrobiia bacterium]
MTSRLPPLDRRILGLALPALGALAADPLLSLADTFFVGRLGAVELAALGVDAALFAFAFALFNFLAYATTPMVASAVGRGADSEAGRVVARALTVAAVLGVAALAVFLVGAPAMVSLMRAPAEVVEPAVEYLRIRSLSIPALLVITAGHGAFRGFQDTRTPLRIALVANGVNIALDPLFMFAAGLGLAGAAWATVIAQWGAAAWFLTLLGARARRQGWDRRIPGLVELTPFLRVGGVLVVRTLMLVVALAASTAAAASIGVEEVAAHQVVVQVWFLLAMLVDALAIVGQAMVAEAWGRDDRAGARRVAARLLRWGLGVGIALGAVLALLGPYLGPWFSSDPAVAALVGEAAVVAALMQPVAALVFVLDGVFLGTLSIRLLAASTAAGLAAALALLGVTLALGWGLVGVWWSIAGMVGARGLVLGFFYVRTWSRA